MLLLYFEGVVLVAAGVADWVGMAILHLDVGGWFVVVYSAGVIHILSIKIDISIILL
jgi:hypothetical protein